MELINGQLFYDLEPYLDMAAFDQLGPKIAMSIAKNHRWWRVSGTGQATLYDQSLTSVFDRRNQLIGSVPEGTFDIDEDLVYAKLMGGVTLGTHLMLRVNPDYPATYHLKHLASGNASRPCDKDFDFLHDWISAQNCFSEYGRVIFWINESGQRTAAHRDYSERFTWKDPFIWMTGTVPKRLIIEDTETGEQHVSNTRACVFNTHNVHNSMGDPRLTSWSLRIDGVFTPEWLARTGLEGYFDFNR